MADGPMHASWHPALMPNTSDDLPNTATTSRTFDAPTENLKETSFSSWEETQGIDGADPLFGQDGEEQGGVSVGTEDAVMQSTMDDHHNPSDSSTEPATKETHDSDESAQATSPTKAPTSQHASSMSFARTVSHGPDFNDDDDAEWNLSRTNTDPFKFMAPSDRTNTFPTVPPIEPSAPIEEAPLPPTQAQEIVEEIENESENEGGHEITAAIPVQTPNKQPSSSHRRSAPSMGGDAQAVDEGAQDRFEEGVPLLPNHHHATEPLLESTNPTSSAGPHVPFDIEEEEDGEEAFFSELQSSEPPQQSEDLEQPQKLERKSTFQAMGDVTGEPLSRQNTLAALQEEEGPDDWLQSGTSQDQPPVDNKGTDLSANWQAAFGDDDGDDDFLLDDGTNNIETDDIDAAAFLGSDDEGLLDDVEDPTASSKNAPTPSKPQSKSYIPSSVPQASPYGQPLQQSSLPNPYLQQTSFAPTGITGQTQPPPNEVSTGAAQSFANQSKGGYASPYDLPTDLATTIKPRKRPSMQQMGQSAPAQPSQPPRSVSASVSSPTSANQPPPLAHTTSMSSLPKSSSGFFEDLPMASRPRPASRQSARTVTQSQPPPPGSTLAQTAPPAVPAGPPPSNLSSDSIPSLVAPARVSPYASLPTATAQPPPATSLSNTRYSPAPGTVPNGATPPAATSATRYSPAPSQSRPGSSYGAAAPIPSATPPILAHQPRTSSPLAHFESHVAKEGALADRRASSSYEHRMNRVPSLPPTREVEEEDDRLSGPVNSLPKAAAPGTIPSRYSPAVPHQNFAAPTPPSTSGMPPPPKRTTSNYAPQVPQPASPQRSLTQSPERTRSLGYAPQQQQQYTGQASLSMSPAEAQASQTAGFAPATRPRRQTLQMNCEPPTDGREHDPLERWKGVPVLSWGVGGTVVTTFPKSIPRYAMNQSTPTVLRTNGEVKVSNMKTLEPLEARLSGFPGPLRGKSKKKETITWLTAGIDTLEKEIPDLSFHSELSLEAKRTMERLLLWRILRVFIEHDGCLEGNASVEKAVREVLAPSTGTLASADSVQPGTLGSQASTLQADNVDSGAAEQIRESLMNGQREAAVWTAADKRLWGHALLIANTISADLYKQVAQEFVRKEVNHPGHNQESIAALYQVFAGNYEDCIDELVPSHARAGLQLMSTQTASNPSKGTTDGLDKWQETLTLVLSNRSPNDIKGLKSLGNLLATYGRAEAAHVCFLFSRQVSVFAGSDDPNVDFVLLGSDHRQQSDQFAKETEALQLSEVYEYGLTLAGSAASSTGAPHLAAYKLQHAVTLAEYGYREKALQYCDAITAAMTSQTKRSPYYHAPLETAVMEFMTRLKQAPKGEATGWMSKPSMNKVSDSMWNRFNKFVAGDENEGSPGASGEGENGPFAHVASTPNISRSPSFNNFDMYGQAASPAYGMPQTQSAVQNVPQNASSSRYAPAAGTPTAQPMATANPYTHTSAPAAAMPVTHNANEHPSASYAPPFAGAPAAPITNGGYAPIRTPEPIHPANLGQEGAQASPGFPMHGIQDSPDTQPFQGGARLTDSPLQVPQATPYGYEPPQMNFGGPLETAQEPTAEASPNSYEPPSFQPYGYEPPSYQPDADPEDGDDEPKPKKKSFMDDDEDDIPALRAQSQERSKADKDRENQEMVRKAAEEDAKRAAAQQQAKKGWGFGGWFGGAKKGEMSPAPAGNPNKPIAAKLGETSTFVFDPDLKRWINKKPGAENAEAKAAAPPPPKGGAPRSVSGTPPPPSSMGTSTPPPMAGRMSVPPPRSMPSNSNMLSKAASVEHLGPPTAAAGTPPMARSVSNTSAAGGGGGPATGTPPPSGPPSRPTTSMSNASSIDDLLGAPGTMRRAGGKKPRKSGRYVDVMAKDA